MIYLYTFLNLVANYAFAFSSEIFVQKFIVLEQKYFLDGDAPISASLILCMVDWLVDAPSWIMVD